MKRLTKDQVIDLINAELEGLYNYPELESYLETKGINYKPYKKAIHEVICAEGDFRRVRVNYPGGKFYAWYEKEWGFPACLSL